MDRGYLKFWRKAHDSASWNRGLLYQGLMINFLSRALWKKGSYQGYALEPGQFGVVLNQLAESLNQPRSTLQRMVAHLAADGFIEVLNVGHRFCIITIVNWSLYQSSESEDGPPAGRPRQTTVQNVGRLPIRKKKEEIESKTPPPPEGEGEAFSSARKKGGSAKALATVIAAYTPSPELRTALEDFRQMRERLRKPLTVRALELILKKLDSLARSDPEKIAILEQSIVKGWQDVFPLKDTQFNRAPPDPPPMTPEQLEAQRKRGEAYLQKLARQSRAESQKFLNERKAREGRT